MNRKLFLLLLLSLAALAAELHLAGVDGYGKVLQYGSGGGVDCYTLGPEVDEHGQVLFVAPTPDGSGYNNGRTSALRAIYRSSADLSSAQMLADGISPCYQYSKELGYSHSPIDCADTYWGVKSCNGELYSLVQVCAAVSSDYTYHVFTLRNEASGKEISLEGCADYGNVDMVFSGDGKSLAVNLPDLGKLRLFDLPLTGTVKAEIDTDGGKAALAKDASSVIYSRYEDGTYNIYSWEYGREGAAPQLIVEAGKAALSSNNHSLDLACRGTQIAGSGDGNFFVFLTYSKSLVPIESSSGDLRQIGTQVMLATKSAAGWNFKCCSTDVEAGKYLYHCREPEISANGRYVAFVAWASEDAGQDELFVYDVNSGELECVTEGNAQIEGRGIRRPALSANGRFACFVLKAPEGTEECDAVWRVFFEDINEAPSFSSLPEKVVEGKPVDLSAFVLEDADEDYLTLHLYGGEGGKWHIWENGQAGVAVDTVTDLNGQVVFICAEGACNSVSCAVAVTDDFGGSAETTLQVLCDNVNLPASEVWKYQLSSGAKQYLLLSMPFAATAGDVIAALGVEDIWLWDGEKFITASRGEVLKAGRGFVVQLQGRASSQKTVSGKRSEVYEALPGWNLCGVADYCENDAEVSGYVLSGSHYVRTYNLPEAGLGYWKYIKEE